MSRSRDYVAKFLVHSNDVFDDCCVGVLWDRDVLCYTNNLRLAELTFSLSASQEWLATVAQLRCASEEDASVEEQYLLYKNGTACVSIPGKNETFPFSLFNHLLCMLRHRTCKNELLPIAIEEYAYCMYCRSSTVIDHLARASGQSLSLIAQLSGLFVTGIDHDSLPAHIVNWIWRSSWHRPYAGFIYRFIATPCQYADSLSYIYQVSISDCGRSFGRKIKRLFLLR